MPSGLMWIGSTCGDLSHPVVFKRHPLSPPDTMFPPSASSCRVPPAVSTVGDFFCSGMAVFPSGNGGQVGKALVALEHKFLIADARPVLDLQA